MRPLNKIEPNIELCFTTNKTIFKKNLCIIYFTSFDYVLDMRIQAEPHALINHMHKVLQ